MGVDQAVGGDSGLHPVCMLLWAWVTTMTMLLSFSVCAWHRRRMQRMREGRVTRVVFLYCTTLNSLPSQPADRSTCLLY